MERKEGNLNRVLPMAVGGVSLVILLAVGGTVSGGQKSDCDGKAVWDKDIAVCLSKEGEIIVQGSNTSPVPLPKGVCQISQVWAGSEEIVGYVIHRGDWIKFNSIDLKTGRRRESGSHKILDYDDARQDPCKK